MPTIDHMIRLINGRVSAVLAFIINFWQVSLLAFRKLVLRYQ